MRGDLDLRAFLGGVLRSRTDQAIEVGLFDDVVVDEDEVANAEVRELVDHQAAEPAEADYTNTQRAEPSLQPGAKRPHLPIEANVRSGVAVAAQSGPMELTRLGEARGFDGQCHG